MFALLFITTSYGIANLYVFLKLSAILELGLPGDLFLGLLIMLLTVFPTLIQIYSLRVNTKLLTVFHYIGYMWLALLVPFFASALLLEIYNLIFTYSGLIANSELNIHLLSPERIVSISSIIAAAVVIYGFFEAKNLEIERLTIRTAKLPDGVERIRIAQISDLHLGVVVKDEMLQNVISIIENEKPDLIVSTGDLVDGAVCHISHLAEVMSNIKAGLGKFAVLGNHEIYGGLKKTTKFIKDSGFTLLRGEGATINNVINIAGMDFRGGEAKRIRKNSPQQEWEVLSQLPDNLFTLLLKHRSDIEKKSLGRFDLQLSGHTHKGQIFPINLAVSFIFQYITGFTQLFKGSAIYVSRGAGTAGPPVRFLSRPEVTIIDVVPD
jgi:predicted MPP superfamily phosphohydrolase